MVAFQVMHVLPAKHNDTRLPKSATTKVWLPKCDYRTDAWQSDPYVPLSFPGDTTMNDK